MNILINFKNNSGNNQIGIITDKKEKDMFRANESSTVRVRVADSKNRYVEINRSQINSYVEVETEFEKGHVIY